MECNFRRVRGEAQSGPAGAQGTAAATLLPLHAVVMTTGYGIALVTHATWPAALLALCSFMVQIACAARRWTPDGRFGMANLVTLVRLLLLLVAAAWLSRFHDAGVLALLAVSFALDAVDGALARRRGSVSEFGATFDTETDAVFVMILGLVLWRRAGFGDWVLVPGVLRYAFVLSLALAPATSRPVVRSRFGRRAFLASSILLLGALALQGPRGRVLAAIGTALSCASFALSFWQVHPALSRTVAALGRSLWQSPLRGLLFLVAWCFLDVLVNVRYPAPEPAGWYFLPSLDVTVLLAALALLGLAHRRLPAVLRGVLVVALVMARALRFGDGVTQQSFGKVFNVYTDLPLVPELVRYAHSTFSAWKFYGGVLGALALLATLVLVVDLAVRYAANYLREPQHALLFALLAAPFAIASATIDHDARYNQRYAGAFAASVLPRFQHEAQFLLNVVDHRQAEMVAIARTQDRLRQTPSRLERLHHANVYLIFVESYGATVFDRPSFAQAAVPAMTALEEELRQHGFSSASGLLESATYGGMSWLAHATMLTGVRTINQLQYDLLGVSHPRTLASIARDAGYRTVLVEPNTTRRSRVADFYDFDKTLSAWSFDYKGPPFAWATMPDQYVLDYVRRHVVAVDSRPLFLSYVLVSSHAPWSHVPTMIDDWSRVGNGDIYNGLPVLRADTNWPDFSNASEPYLHSILYDFQVLGSYLTHFVDDDSLFVILGDHQPVSEITEGSASWAVPIHVISRKAAFVEPFFSHGYRPGLVPGQAAMPMESFMIEFVRDFSGGAS